MKVSYEHIGFITGNELFIKKIGESQFVLLPEQFGMFYILPEMALKVNLDCKLCGTKRGMDEEVTLLAGNETVFGMSKCDICNNYSLIVFRAETIIRMIKELDIPQFLINEYWGHVCNLYSN
jgi:hypothetical protein